MQTNETSLQMAVVPQSFLNKMEEKMETLENILRDKSEQEINSQWIESVKIPKLLGINPKLDVTKSLSPLLMAVSSNKQIILTITLTIIVHFLI